MTFTDVLSQPAYPGAKPEEVAEVFIDKFVYSDWETVWVQHRWHDAWPIFRITTAERDPVAELWARLQIIPGDLCLIKLGGVVAITGVVTVRQTAYDANSHAVSIQGMGVQWFTWRGAILDKTQEFHGGYVDVATRSWRRSGSRRPSSALSIRPSSSRRRTTRSASRSFNSSKSSGASARWCSAPTMPGTCC